MGPLKHGVLELLSSLMRNASLPLKNAASQFEYQIRMSPILRFHRGRTANPAGLTLLHHLEYLIPVRQYTMRVCLGEGWIPPHDRTPQERRHMADLHMRRGIIHMAMIETDRKESGNGKERS
jgi:hypothetical protein